MATDQPEVTIRTGFSSTMVMFEAKVTNPTSGDLRTIRLTPKPIPPSTWVDREQHLIPLLRSRRSRKAAFRLRPSSGQEVVAMDLTVEWEDAYGASRGRLEVSSKPVELSVPPLRQPSEGMDRWRAGLSGGVAVELRLRQEPPPEKMVDILKEALVSAPGKVSVQREEGPRGASGRVWVRAEGSRGRRAGLLVDITPDPVTGGSRVLLTATATTEELLTMFYHACLSLMAEALPGIDGIAPHSLSDIQ